MSHACTCSISDKRGRRKKQDTKWFVSFLLSPCSSSVSTAPWLIYPGNRYFVFAKSISTPKLHCVKYIKTNFFWLLLLLLLPAAERDSSTFYCCCCHFYDVFQDLENRPPRLNFCSKLLCLHKKVCYTQKFKYQHHIHFCNKMWPWVENFIFIFFLKPL